MTVPTSAPACAAVILAAGRSTRMRSAIPKPLHTLCGRPLTRLVIDACRRAGIERVVVVVGHESEMVRAGLGDDVEYALQTEQRGSGDAARAAEPVLRGFSGEVLVLAGDVPLLKPETLKRLVAHHRRASAAATLLTATLDDPTGYGRILRSPEGTVARIVEHNDATPEERTIKEWNPSLYCFDAAALFGALARIRPNNAQRELQLTDTVGVLTADGGRVEAVATDDAREVAGVNTRVELAAAAATLRRRLLTDLMLSGVTVVDPAATYVDVGVTVGRDTVLEPQTFLHGDTALGEGCAIGPFACLRDCRVGDRCVIVASHLVSAEIGSSVRIGPFANLRPGCRLADGVRIGDFVELKNTALGPGTSASHLTYLGDAEVGARANIGAGVVTCNYDGFRKHRTVIGDGAFVGTHTTFIAPLEVGAGAVTAAGSVLTEDVPTDSLAIARSRAVIKPDWARRWRAAREKHDGSDA